MYVSKIILSTEKKTRLTQKHEPASSFRTSNGNYLPILDSQRRNNFFGEDLIKSTLYLQLLQRQHIIILSEKSSVDKFQTKGLIILVVVIFGAEVFVTIAWGVFLEESGKVFQVFLLVSFEVAAYYDNTLVGDTSDAAAVFPETDV